VKEVVVEPEGMIRLVFEAFPCEGTLTQAVVLKPVGYMTQPLRYVVDIDRAVLGSPKLLTPQVFQKHPLIRRVRMGQVFPTTVRMVLDLAEGQGIKLTPFEDVDNPQLIMKLEGVALPKTIETQTSLNPNPVYGSQAVTHTLRGTQLLSKEAHTLPSQLTRILASPLQADSKQSKFQLSGSHPISLKATLLKAGPSTRTGDDVLYLELLNIAPPAGGATMQFQVQDVPHINEVRWQAHPTVSTGSTIVIRYNVPVSGFHWERDVKDTQFTFTLQHDPSRPKPPIVTPPPILKPPPVESPAQAPPLRGKGLVVIDAGHGGKDAGAMRENIKEKDLNLTQALRLKQILEASGLTVRMTRNQDIFLALPEITSITNRVKPDVFVSIHQNSSTSDKPRGMETYFYTAQSRLLADLVHQERVKSHGSKSPNNGVKRAMFYVIHHTDVPAILCEIGYLSNPSERLLLINPSYQQAHMEAIARGVLQFLKSRP
jgi:N-acetylmuramoyl-L-alanine amidase